MQAWRDIETDIRRLMEGGVSENSVEIQRLRKTQEALSSDIASGFNDEGIGTIGGIYKRSASEYFLEPANLFGYEMPFTPVAFDIATGVAPGYALAKYAERLAPLTRTLSSRAGAIPPGASPTIPDATRALPASTGAMQQGAGRAQMLLPQQGTRLTPTQTQKIDEIARQLGVTFEEAARLLGITP